MADPKWKKFEDLAYKIQKDLVNDAQVKRDDRIIGVDSKTFRQIDISIRHRIGQYSLLIVIDCKDLKDPLDVKDIGEFVTVVKDVRANKGAVVSSTGFTPAAIELAKTHGVDTYRLIDTESFDWKTYVSIPVLLERNFLKNFRLKFTNFQMLPSEIRNTDLRIMRVFDNNGSFLGTIHNIMAKRWNNEEIQHDPGQIEVSIGNNLFIEIAGQRVKTDIIAECIVKREFYFGNLPVNLKGFKDEQSGGIITRSITTENIKPFEIEQGQVEGWIKIDDPKQLASQPLMKLCYSDIIPEL